MILEVDDLSDNNASLTYVGGKNLLLNNKRIVKIMRTM